MAARWYNDALINPEENGDGGTTIRAILDWGYPHIQLRRPGQGIPEHANWRTTYGTSVTSANRNDLVNHLRTGVREESITVYHDGTLREMTTFLYDKHNKPDHLPGKHSDNIFACIHALYADSILMEARGLEAPKVVHGDWAAQRREELRERMMTRAEKRGRRGMRGRR